MRWQGREGSGNVEDRRGSRVGGVGLPLGGGIGGIVLILLLSAVTGQNPLDLIGAWAAAAAAAAPVIPKRARRRPTTRRRSSSASC